VDQNETAGALFLTKEGMVSGRGGRKQNGIKGSPRKEESSALMAGFFALFVP